MSKLTLDEVKTFKEEIGEPLDKLRGFYSLFRRKHERWTAEAFMQAVEDLDEVCGSLFRRLHELDDVKGELEEEQRKLKLVRRDGR